MNGVAAGQPLAHVLGDQEVQLGTALADRPPVRVVFLVVVGGLGGTAGETGDAPGHELLVEGVAQPRTTPHHERVDLLGDLDRVGPGRDVIPNQAGGHHDGEVDTASVSLVVGLVVGEKLSHRVLDVSFGVVVDDGIGDVGHDRVGALDDPVDDLDAVRGHPPVGGTPVVAFKGCHAVGSEEPGESQLTALGVTAGPPVDGVLDAQVNGRVPVQHPVGEAGSRIDSFLRQSFPELACRGGGGCRLGGGCRGGGGCRLGGGWRGGGGCRGGETGRGGGGEGSQRVVEGGEHLPDVVGDGVLVVVERCEFHVQREVARFDRDRASAGGHEPAHEGAVDRLADYGHPHRGLDDAGHEARVRLGHGLPLVGADADAERA